MTTSIRHILGTFRRRVRGQFDYLAWQLQGKRGPTPHLAKGVLIRATAQQYGITTLIETGTFLGDTVALVQDQFRSVRSIEIDPTLYEQARARFAHTPTVEIVQGDSARILPEIIRTLREPALFWLDGHYSSGITGRGEKETPIMEEIAAIAASPVVGHVILVDDARLFDGSHDYPTLGALRARSAALLPTHVFDVKDDIIRILP